VSALFCACVIAVRIGIAVVAFTSILKPSMLRMSLPDRNASVLVAVFQPCARNHCAMSDCVLRPRATRLDATGQTCESADTLDFAETLIPNCFALL